MPKGGMRMRLYLSKHRKMKLVPNQDYREGAKVLLKCICEVVKLKGNLQAAEWERSNWPE